MDECKTSMEVDFEKFIKISSWHSRKINETKGYLFIENVLLREEIREKLKSIYDIERIIGSYFETWGENGRDLISFKNFYKNS